MNTEPQSESALVQLAESNTWAVKMAAEKTHVFFQGVDVTDEINLEEVGNLASVISQFSRVRKSLLDAQRRCALGVNGLVAEGRDCGTVVFPGADVKVFLTARAEDRAVRRAKEEGKSVSETRGVKNVSHSRAPPRGQHAGKPVMIPPGQCASSRQPHRDSSPDRRDPPAFQDLPGRQPPGRGPR
jgi:cytidylate kinase